VWIGVGGVVLMAMRRGPTVAAEQAAPVASAVD